MNKYYDEMNEALERAERTEKRTDLGKYLKLKECMCGNKIYKLSRKYCGACRDLPARIKRQIKEQRN